MLTYSVVTGARMMSGFSELSGPCGCCHCACVIRGMVSFLLYAISSFSDGRCWVESFTKAHLDYLHLTKRFGIIPISQLPFQVFLGLKVFNPFAYLFRSSYEQVNRYHRVLGRVLYGFIIVHIILYNTYFILTGKWFNRFFTSDVLAGVIASLFLHAMITTTLRQIREKSYQIFFFTHIVAAFAIPALIFWHAPPVRFYVFEAVAVVLEDFIVRKWKRTTLAATTVEAVPGTNLLKITATLPQVKMIRYGDAPGAHVYLNLPSDNRPSYDAKSWDFRKFALIFNPFTVSSINHDTNTITLVARKGSGPLTTHLKALSDSSPNSSFNINIEGPYGAIRKQLPSLLNGGFDRILLFAGGIGATFALPVYRAILADNTSAKVKVIWAVRTAGDATWAFSSPSSASDRGNTSIMDDDNVEMYITSDMSGDSEDEDNGQLQQVGGRTDGSNNHRRPDVTGIIHETFQAGRNDSVAVLVCGPEEMASEARAAVRSWAMKGRKVWWHNEAFGW